MCKLLDILHDILWEPSASRITSLLDAKPRISDINATAREQLMLCEILSKVENIWLPFNGDVFLDI